MDAKGKVAPRKPLEEQGADVRHDSDFTESLRKQKEAVESWQKKIDLILDNCNDTDVAFKNALEANDTEGKDFSSPKYKNLDQEEVARAVALAAKGRDITHAQLQSLNELLRDNAKSPEFAKGFYEKLGPEKSLAFFGQLATDTHEGMKGDEERLKDVQALQKNLGLNLATASHDRRSPRSGAQSSAKWARNVSRWPSTTTVGRTGTSCSAASCGTGTMTPSSSNPLPSMWSS